MLIRCLHETLVEQFPPTWTLYCSTLWFRNFAPTEHYMNTYQLVFFPKTLHIGQQTWNTESKNFKGQLQKELPNVRENKGEWFGMMCLLGAIRRL